MTVRFSRLLVAGGAALGASALGSGAALASSETGIAQAQPTSTITVPRERAGDPNRQVCTTTRITGSRFPRRICRTQAERDAELAAQQDNVRDYQHHDGSTPGVDQFGTAVGPRGQAGPSPN